MTSLPVLLTTFAVVGALLTFLTRSQSKNLLVSFLQYFCGVWFIFSGAVKAVDPIGTAYKMEDYFVQFETTFAGLQNMFKGIAPMFPALAKMSTGFAIFMVVLEIVLGLMLIVGFRRQLTAWLFFLIVAFFTVLTGFTYLTGFVPSDANFFDFAKWGPFVKTQMRVTDCGCFGDFIKLDPRTSFYKDVFLMVPALLFLFRSKWMHQILAKRGPLVLLVTAATAFFCYRNSYLNLPVVDFRPFAIGNNIRQMKETESEARGNVQITGWVLENTNTGKVEIYTEPEPGKFTYLKQYPKDQGWKVKDQIKNEPFIEKDGQKILIKETKVSDFAVEDAQNGEVGEDILNEKGYSLMIVAYHLDGAVEKETYTIQDTTWAVDTVKVEGSTDMKIVKSMTGTQARSETREIFVPTPEFSSIFKDKVNPAAAAAKKAGWKVYAITTVADGNNGLGLATKTGADYPFYRADDKLLKTIIRANPGFVILKDGQVMGMYHNRHLPTGDEMLGKFK